MAKPAVTLQDIVNGQVEMSRAIADLASAQKATTEELRELKDYTVGGFETVDGRFDRLEDRFDRLEDRFDTLESSLPYQH